VNLPKSSIFIYNVSTSTGGLTPSQMSEMAASFPDSLAALYQLHQLDADRREIRLIVLQPGTPKDPIVVELKTESLNDNVSYEAISYA
jgi:hypothetical protein